MLVRPALVESIASLLVSVDGGQLFVGRPPLARALRRASPRLVLAETKARRPTRRLARQTRSLPVVKATAGALPVATRGLGAVVASDVLTRSRGPELIAGWHSRLRQGGLLVVVTPSPNRWQQLSACLRRRPAVDLHPEDLTCLLLNGGFERIAQRWPPGSIVTLGYRR